MSILLTQTPQQQSSPIKTFRARLQCILDALAQRIALIKSNQREIVFSLYFVHSKKKQIQLQTYWTFQIDKEIDIVIQIKQNACFSEPDQTIAVNQLITRMNRQIYEGIYFMDSSRPYLLKFKTKIAFQIANRYFASSLSQLYKQAEVHFINYAVKLKMLGGFSQAAQDETHKSIILLRKLKEHFEVQRLKRPKATQYYDLNNCSIKIVNEALILINSNLSLLKSYKNNEIKMDSRRKLDCQNSNHFAFKRYSKCNPEDTQTQINQIASGIQIKRVVSEVKIDESKFNIIYRGVYDISTSFTVNSYLFNCQYKSLNQQDATIELVKKVAISQALEDLSFKNQIDFLKFMRMKKNKRIGEYFISLTSSNQVIDNSIYSMYYPCCLATKYVEWDERMLLRATLQLIEGICFMNNNRILHRDLKEWNVLIDKQGNIRIIDFGSTSGIYGNKQNDFTCKEHLMSTPNYYYPYSKVHKLISKNFSKEEYNQWETFDVYSFGVILSNLFSLNNIFDCMLFRQLDYLSKKCRQVNPEDRPRPQQVMVYLHEILLLHMSQNKSAYQSKANKAVTSN